MTAQLDNPTRGTAEISLDGKTYTMRLNWHGIVKVRRAYPEGYNLADPEHLATVMAIALAEHHPDITADHVMDMSPPIEKCIEAVTDCINYAWWGAPEPPERKPEDQAENPRKRAARAA